MNEDLNINTIEERFFVHGRMSILSLLNELIHRQEPVTVHFDGGPGHFVTRLLEARDQTLIFDAGSDPDARRELLASAACVFLAYPDGIRIQFTTAAAQPASWDGNDVFCVPLPNRLARLQRQESLRIQIPQQDAPAVELLAHDGATLGRCALHDLSAGGLGVSVDRQPEIALGPQIARVRLSLPGHGEVDSAVTLRHATGLARREVSATYRIGMAFSGLSPAMRAAIQRYIIQTAQDRRDLATDPDTEGDD